MSETGSDHGGAKLDFLEHFRADLARGIRRPLEHYLTRFPEIAAWISAEFSALDREFEPASSTSASSEIADDASLLEHLRGKPRSSDRYARGAELGRGGTSRVYAARDLELGRDLAMKVLRADRARSLRRFLREARITSRLEHPGILPVHELGLDSRGELYFTMRLVRGKSLKQLFDEARADRDRGFRRRALEIVLKVCDTIAFAHSHGVIHRDLKPSNVMLGDYGEVYVVDWGLARELGPARGERNEAQTAATSSESPLSTLDGDVLGTPAYMPPEQAEGRHAAVGPRSDVYALGAMLYHLIAGRAPFLERDSTPSSREVLGRVLAGPPQRLAALAPQVPSELAAIVERSMARDPAARYANGSEMAEDLRAFLEVRAVRAYAAGPFTRARKWMRRNRALAAALGGVALLALGGVLSWRQASAKERDLALLEDLRGPLELLSEFDTLWPVSDRNLPALVSWLSRADRLRARVPQLERSLEELRSSGQQIAQESWIQAKEDERHRRELQSVQSAIDATRDRITTAEFNPSASTGTPLEMLRTNLASLQRQKLVFEARKPARVAWNFEDARTQLLHDRLEQFLSEYDLVCGRNGESQFLRLARAAASHFDATSGGDRAESAHLWQDAVEAIARSPRYAGLRLTEQEGLWPLGPDPRSNLWEFAQTDSGAIPTRDAEGSLQLTADSAVVLVLIPGGSAVLGAQCADPMKPAFDPRAISDDGPTIESKFEPFFLGKLEVSAAQWSRLTGFSLEELGLHQHGGSSEPRVLPARNMTGEWAQVVLGAYGLELPTSLRWEYAARAGSETPWWCGSEAASIRGAGNLADRSWQAMFNYPDYDVAGATGYDDGFPSLAPIGSFRANAFGLQDTIGNVWEWCRDLTERRMYKVAPGDELYKRTYGLQIARGGSADDGAFDARSGARLYLRPDYHGVFVGVRASRSIRP